MSETSNQSCATWDALRSAASTRAGGGMPRSRPITAGLWRIGLLAVLFGTVPGGAQAASAASKLDPALAAALASGAESLTVWVSFRDKGEQGPRELAERLARAAVDLTPRARARRERAQVWPLVDYRDLPLHEPYLAELRAAGFAPHAASRWLNRAAVRMASPRAMQLAAFPFVERLSQVSKVRRSPPPLVGDEVGFDALTRPPLATASSVAYGLTLNQSSQINVPAVHDSGYIGTGVLVCFLDEGYNFHDKHEALRDQIIAPGHTRDFVDGDDEVADTTSSFGFNHGTWVWAAAAGKKPGVYMGSGFGADYALARTENGFSETPIEMLYWGMGAEWADSLGADVISSSLGYYQFDNSADDYTYADLDGQTTDVSRAAQIAASKGMLVVTAAGNLGSSSWLHIVAPADVNGDSLIAVGAVDSMGVPASFSSEGPSADGRIKPDLSVRGVKTPTASVSGDPNVYVSLSGTSLSTPILAGLVACLVQARPNWTPKTIIRALRETASHASTPNDKIGYGIPDGLAALQWSTALLDTPPPAPPARLSLAILGPNPLRGDGGSLRVRFAPARSAPSGAAARLVVMDAGGRMVRELWSGTLEPGEWTSSEWDGRGKDGHLLSAGVYWIQLRTRSESASARVVSLR